MKILLTILVLSFIQAPVTVVKNNGDEVVLTEVRFYQTDDIASVNMLAYSYRGQEGKIPISQIKRISFKESVKRKKGIATYMVILVKSDNSKLEVEMDLNRLEGIGQNGKAESMNLTSVDKISF
ncbi:MAG: hypothetical protein RLN88_02865 [Ekhidna sp.]|uniref:hypothetical protein n=1 Tax=Ekhidna sp. TaxID=2608089 RepID=UPI0032EB222D